MLPNFLLIGAARSATTALRHDLALHPRVFMSPLKEPQFFACEGGRLDFSGPGDEVFAHGAAVADPAAYQALFRGASGFTAVGEASTWHLYHPQAAARIRRRLGEVKLLAILRDPVERAYSAWLRTVRDGLEPLDFEAAVEAEGERVRAGWSPVWHHVQRGFYAAQLERYYAAFPADRIRVYLFEDYRDGRPAMLRDLMRFLGVEPVVPAVSQRHNAAGIPRSRTLLRLARGPAGSFLRRVLPDAARARLSASFDRLNLARPAMPEAVRARLRRLYEPDVARLERLIGRDLSHWRR